MTFLFIAILGPVQPFIASSRRTHDLFAGSMLLSELSRTAAYEIAKREKADIESLIFPAPLSLEELDDENEKRSLNVANKIVAMVEQLPDELGNAVYEAIQERLRKIKGNCPGGRATDPQKEDLLGCPRNGKWRTSKNGGESSQHGTPLLAHGGEVAANDTEGRRTIFAPKGARNLLLDFNHPKIPFSQIVRKWQRKVIEESQHLIGSM